MYVWLWKTCGKLCGKLKGYPQPAKLSGELVANFCHSERRAVARSRRIYAYSFLCGRPLVGRSFDSLCSLRMTGAVVKWTIDNGELLYRRCRRIKSKGGCLHPPAGRRGRRPLRYIPGCGRRAIRESPLRIRTERVIELSIVNHQLSIGFISCPAGW